MRNQLIICFSCLVLFRALPAHAVQTEFQQVACGREYETDYSGGLTYSTSQDPCGGTTLGGVQSEKNSGLLQIFSAENLLLERAYWSDATSVFSNREDSGMIAASPPGKDSLNLWAKRFKQIARAKVSILISSNRCDNAPRPPATVTVPNTFLNILRKHNLNQNSIESYASLTFVTHSLEIRSLGYRNMGTHSCQPKISHTDLLGCSCLFVIPFDPLRDFTHQAAVSVGDARKRTRA